MSEWICDDRESPEEWLERITKIRNMTDEEFEKYLKEKEESGGKKIAV